MIDPEDLLANPGMESVQREILIRGILWSRSMSDMVHIDSTTTTHLSSIEIVEIIGTHTGHACAKMEHVCVVIPRLRCASGALSVGSSTTNGAPSVQAADDYELKIQKKWKHNIRRHI